MSESAPFGIGYQEPGTFLKEDIDAEYLTGKGFTSTDEDFYSKEIEPGRVLHTRSKQTISVTKGGVEPVLIAEGSPSVHFLEGLWKTMTGSNL